MAEQKSKFITRGWTTFSLLLLILAAFLLAGLDGLRRQELLSPYDTDLYLWDARQIHDRGGPPALVAMCFTGHYTRDFIMPLYVGLLSMLPCDSPQVFAWARLLTLVLGAAGITVAFIVAQRLFGSSAALLTAALMALNSAYLSYSTIVGCDILFVAFVLLAWFAVARYLEGRSRFAWIGLWVALAYLTKANGVFIAPVALGAAWFKERGRILRSKQVWLGIAIFLLVASPILTRNILRFGSPFHNLNSRVLWVDSWNEMYGPDVQEHPPTLTRYLQRHTLGQIGLRIAKGAFQEGVFLVVGTGQNYLLHDDLRLKAWPVGLLLIGLSLWGALDRRTWHAAIPVVGLGAVFFIFFTWFPVKDLRFDLPLVPIVLIFSARGVTCGCERLMRLKRGGFSFSAPTATIYLAGAIAVAGIGAATATLAACRAPPDICKFPPGYEQLLRWRRT
jgi:4-amino-4-deoxy-L-arabinose transferase-like glycosyltransferase